MRTHYITYLVWRDLGGKVDDDGLFVHPVLQPGTADADEFEQMVSSNWNLASLEGVLQSGMGILELTGECERLQNGESLSESEIESYTISLMCCVCSAGWQTRAKSDGTVSICANHPDYPLESITSRVEKILNREPWRKYVFHNGVVHDNQPAPVMKMEPDERIELPF